MMQPWCVQAIFLQECAVAPLPCPDSCGGCQLWDISNKINIGKHTDIEQNIRVLQMCL
jgi:hypothetical protein